MHVVKSTCFVRLRNTDIVRITFWFYLMYTVFFIFRTVLQVSPIVQFPTNYAEIHLIWPSGKILQLSPLHLHWKWLQWKYQFKPNKWKTPTNVLTTKTLNSDSSPFFNATDEPDSITRLFSLLTSLHRQCSETQPINVIWTMKTYYICLQNLVMSRNSKFKQSNCQSKQRNKLHSADRSILRIWN